MRQPTNIVESYNSVSSITLGELRDAGAFAYETDEHLFWDYYDAEQYERVCKKILGRFKYRDIGVIPYARWRDAYVRKMNEIMPKYKPLYQELENGTSILQTEDRFGKHKAVYSSFPQTPLSGDQDYADSMNIDEHEDIANGDWIDKANEVAKGYNDVDVMILDELETLFSCLFSVNMNGF